MTKAWQQTQGGNEPKVNLGIPCSASLNRRMRTRMYGGVGRGPGNGHPYPISSAIRLTVPFQTR